MHVTLDGREEEHLHWCAQMKERRKWTDAMLEYHKSEDPHSPDNFNSPLPPLARWSVSSNAPKHQRFHCSSVIKTRVYTRLPVVSEAMCEFDFVALNNAAWASVNVEELLLQSEKVN